MKSINNFLLISIFLIIYSSVTAQQWAGSATTSDLISRYGNVTIFPTADNLPYTEIANNKITLKNYNAVYPGTFLELTKDQIVFSYAAPGGSSTATIQPGAFSFNYGAGTSTNFKFENGIASTTKNFIIKYNSYNNVILGNSNGGALYGNGYIGFNALRSASNWTLTSNGTLNGGGIMYSTNSGDIIFTSIASTGNTTQTVSDNTVYTNASLRITPTTVFTKEIQVKANVWADIVFKPNYILRPLAEVEQFIQTNSHLPDVPSEAEVLENGINVAEMNAVLLKKIEELTLYTISLQKQVTELQIQIEKK